jgi:hypothetical protein
MVRKGKEKMERFEIKLLTDKIDSLRGKNISNEDRAFLDGIEDGINLSYKEIDNRLSEIENQ